MADPAEQLCLVPEELRGEEEEWACCPPGTNADCTNAIFEQLPGFGGGAWVCHLVVPTPTPKPIPTPCLSEPINLQLHAPGKISAGQTQQIRLTGVPPDAPIT